MPRILRAIGDEFKSRLSQNDTAPVNRYEGFQGNGSIVLRDRRGTTKADFPDAEEKGVSLGSDPLAIYKPTGAKSVSAAKAMASFTGWTFAGQRHRIRSLQHPAPPLPGNRRRPRGAHDNAADVNNVVQNPLAAPHKTNVAV